MSLSIVSIVVFVFHHLTRFLPKIFDTVQKKFAASKQLFLKLKKLLAREVPGIGQGQLQNKITVFCDYCQLSQLLCLFLIISRDFYQRFWKAKKILNMQHINIFLWNLKKKTGIGNLACQLIVSTTEFFLLHLTRFLPKILS